jgi:hypothetical protein
VTLTTVPCLPHISPVIWPAAGAVTLFGILLAYFRLENRGSNYVYFDAQDFAHYEAANLGTRRLPIKKDSTFEPMLKSYIEVMKLLITVAAASVAFGDQHPKLGIILAKIVLAFSILYGVLFCALLQFFYEVYTQNVKSYSPLKYSSIEALGFSALVCFITGYLVWAFNLG